MHLTTTRVFIYLLSIYIISIDSLPVAKIISAAYSTGSSFLKLNLSTSDTCMCYCINHPHCLSISVMSISNNEYYCQLFATYPSNSSQLSLLLISNVTIYTGRTLSSVYLNNKTYLSNPKRLFSNTVQPWIPVVKLFTGNNQLFLGLNSSNLTTLTPIPTIATNQTTAHWFSILISQWYRNLFVPNQVALAFIVNQTIIFDFLIFNASQSDITSWFLIGRLISNQYWGLTPYQSTSQGQTEVKSIYTDSACIRSFNCNFKATTSDCSSDFYGFFFVYGGYKDLCIAAVRNMSTVYIPSIFYSPTTYFTNGNLGYYNISDSLMIFVR